jgi:hypothetical protein
MTAEPGLAGQFSLSFRCGLPFVTHSRYPASIIVIDGLTASLINTCYDRLRSIQNTTTDRKPVITLLRSLDDVLHSLYMAVYAEDPNVSQSSSMLIIDLSNDDSPFVQCTNELHTLERIIDAGNGPLEEPSLANVLDNLKTVEPIC